MFFETIRNLGFSFAFLSVFQAIHFDCILQNNFVAMGWKNKEPELSPRITWEAALEANFEADNGREPGPCNEFQRT